MRLWRLAVAITSVVLVLPANTVVAQTSATRTSTPATEERVLDVARDAVDITVDEILARAKTDRVKRNLPYSIKSEWILDLKQVCPECMSPDYVGSIIRHVPPESSNNDDYICAAHKAVIASLRASREKDALLLMAYKKEIDMLKAKVKTLEESAK